MSLLELENIELKRLLATALQTIEELKALIEKLSVKKTSSNSSIPPSIDIVRKNQSLRAPSGKPAGGQPGHKGTTLQLSATPDVVIDIVAHACSNCGENLEQVTGVLTQRRQVVDVPPVRPVYTGYRQFTKQCPCCHSKQKSGFPKAVGHPIQYGPTVQAMAVYQWQLQFMPFQRLQRWFKDVFGLPIGKGTLENIIRRAAGLALPAYGQVQAQIAGATCVGADETGMKVNGKKQWVWVWQNERYTFLKCSPNRGSATIDGLFPEGFARAILVSDRWKAQLATRALGHQLCLAHLLRDTNYLIEAEPKCNVANGLKALLQKAVEHKKENAQSGTGNICCMEIENGLTALLQQEIDKQLFPLTVTLQKSLNNYRGYLLKFLYHKEVPYENNASERCIRMVKVKQKISGCFKSLQQDFCVLKSVIDTQIKSGAQPLNTIYQIINLRAG